MKTLSIEWTGPDLGAETREILLEADVVIGVDLPSHREFTVYGTPAYESTVTMKKPSAMRVVQVTLDCACGQLEELATLVRDIKGLKVSDSVR
jgi:hypothetical protein